MRRAILNFLSPGAQRNLERILPFGLIWLLTGWVFLVVELAASGSWNPDPSTAITFTWPVAIFASVAVFTMGLLIGALEMIYLRNLFKYKPFAVKFLFKFGLYMALLLAIICITYPIAAMLELQVSLTNKLIWDKFNRFLSSLTFWNTLFQMSFSLLVSLMYAVISENLGHQELVYLISGRYHRPRQEHRIFMFLDMKSSTSIAEQLGHIRYFEFLRAYYAALSPAIIDQGGEVYQYVGDEIVLSWPLTYGKEDRRCLNCFFAMSQQLAEKADGFHKKFGIAPSFKAGLHLGEVTTGEIGDLKKDIMFTGDVLNTTARIQALCNTYNTDLLISGEMVNALRPSNDFEMIHLGSERLRGRMETTDLFTLKKQ